MKTFGVPRTVGIGRLQGHDLCSDLFRRPASYVNSASLCIEDFNKLKSDSTVTSSNYEDFTQ